MRIPSAASVLSLTVVAIASLLTPDVSRAQAAPPRLVVFISVDQFRGDYIERYGHTWTSGLRRLVDEGAWFVQAAYPYLATVTCAGHATMSTGTFPSTHGMVSNEWYDRESGKSVQCTDDASTTIVAYGTPPATAGAAAGPVAANSLARMRTLTFADELRGQASRPPRIVGLSMKPRSAISLAGRKADAAIWFDGSKGGWVSSSAYGDAPNPVIAAFIASHPLERERQKTWTKLLPADKYLYEDDGLAERVLAGWTNQFPHPISAEKENPGPGLYERWEISPFADLYLAQMAIAAVDGFKMGQTPGVDFLGVSFSALDRVGHMFGPRSHEVQDTLAQLDVTLGVLLKALDQRVGRQNYVVALTGDHGVGAIPEQMKALGYDAGRIDARAGRAALEAALAEQLGAGKHLTAISGPFVYLEPGTLEKLRAKPGALDALNAAVAAVPGWMKVIPNDLLASGAPSTDPFVEAARLSYFPGRSGDLTLVLKPFWQGGSGGATHGTPYRYDQRVPVLLMGPALKAGRYYQDASPADIAPTLAAICGITLARQDGRILVEALTSTASAPTPVKRATATKK